MFRWSRPSEMAQATSIEWATHSWNPIVGCDVCSPGCANCYAMGQAARLLDKPGSHYEGTTKRVNGKPVWTGKVAMAPEHILLAPLGWRKPRLIFVNSMSDLFHESIPDHEIDRVFAVMALTRQHTYLVLTKRSQRMRQYMNESWRSGDRLPDHDVERRVNEAARQIDEESARKANLLSEHGLPPMSCWPLPNVWMGVSVEDQRRAEERIPDLQSTLAALRWISGEPLLGSLDLRNIRNHTFYGRGVIDALEGISGVRADDGSWLRTEYEPVGRPGEKARTDPVRVPRLNWVVVGGESGRDARPMHPDWARSVRDQCQAAGVPHFFKQWGEFRPDTDLMNPPGKAVCMDRRGRIVEAPASVHDFPWPRSHADGWVWMRRVGKKRAGRLLDGREWNEVPVVAP